MCARAWCAAAVVTRFLGALAAGAQPVVAGQAPGAITSFTREPSHSGETRVEPVPGNPVEAATRALACVRLLVRGGEALLTTRTVEGEIKRIWRLNGVALVLPSGKELCPAGTARSILVYLVDNPETFPEPSRPRVAPSVLAATASAGRRPAPLVYAFIERAVRQVERGPEVGPMQPRLSLILGRVIAHEIGHVLLDSAAHSPRGLMRARFSGGDCVLRPDDAYTLTPDERVVVHRNLAGASAGTRGLLARAQEPK